MFAGIGYENLWTCEKRIEFEKGPNMSIGKLEGRWLLNFFEACYHFILHWIAIHCDSVEPLVGSGGFP